MAIKFNFTVSDVDAENIMSCLQDRITKQLVMIAKEHGRAHTNNLTGIEKEESATEIEWLENSIEYTKGLMQKMENSRVEE
tara:strand:- start:2727 stop:2969 length:243 start_codon:yes stop_codon:yes gene_type:complete